MLVLARREGLVISMTLTPENVHHSNTEEKVEIKINSGPWTTVKRLVTTVKIFLYLYFVHLYLEHFGVGLRY